MKVLGQTTVSANYKGQEAGFLFIVVAGDGPSLFGRNWLQVIQLDWASLKVNRVEAISGALDKLLEEYQDIFESEVGTLEGYTAHREVQGNATPRFHKPRSLPYALREAIEKELDRLEVNGVLERVNTSRWAVPIVPVPKPDGTVRLCGDYKVTVNSHLLVDQYPLPKPDDTYSQLWLEARRFQSWIWLMPTNRLSWMSHRESW